MTPRFNLRAGNVARSLVETVGVLLALPIRLAVLPLSRMIPAPHRPDSREVQFRIDLWRFRRLLAEAFGSLDPANINAELAWLTAETGRLQRAFVAWADLVELLVQHAETAHAGETGTGRLKKAEVEGALRLLARSPRFAIPGVPAPLAPVLFDIFVSWAIDVIVVQVNARGLWTHDSAAGSGGGWRERLRHWLFRALRPAANLLGWIAARVWYALETPIVTSAEIRAAVQAVEREGFPSDADPVATISRILVWFGTHRDSLVEASELVYSAVQQAETFAALGGPEKKQYVRDLVWAVLADSGLVPASGILAALIDAGIDFLIESSVRLFNKRGLFEHPALTPAVERNSVGG